MPSHPTPTLLSHIARHHTFGHEDVATTALAFILNRSDAVRCAFADFLSDGADAPPLIAKVQAQRALPNGAGAAPDLAGLDEDGNRLAFVESKFWAELTPAQPVAYWEALPADAPATLLFLAPPYRVNRSSLWDDLTGRLRRAGHSLDTTRNGADLKIATGTAQNSGHRLMLATWGLLLDRLAQAALNRQDSQAAFEIAELRGLADSIITGGDSPPDDGFKTLIRDVVNDVVASGWGNASRLGVGRGVGFYARSFRLAGALARLGTSDKNRELMPDTPLILSFWRGKIAPYQVSLDEVRQRLGNEGQPGLGRRSHEVWVPLALPPDAGLAPARHAVADELKRIARLIDPDGPTYRKDTPNA